MPSDAADLAAVREVADLLYGATNEGRVIKPVRTLLPASDIDAAYEAQRINVDRWRADGRRMVGRKIGLTARSVQSQLGVDQPDFGTLFADMEVPSGGEVVPNQVVQPRVEAEVAVVIDRELGPDCTVHDFAVAVDHLLPAIEIVGSRIEDWDIDIVDTIADNASSGAFVLGTNPINPLDVDLFSAGMVLARDGVVESVGAGAACLGHPYNAGAWLARNLAMRGSPLRSGDVLLTGAFGPMVDFPPDSSVVVTIQGLGTVSVRHNGGGR